MRLWSLHPKYLDSRGIVALWREALLAKAVLKGETKGYRNHPQLQRFRLHASPLQALDAYLLVVYEEAALRHYSFDKSKIGHVASLDPIPVTAGQVAYEWQHLLAKLAERAPELYNRYRAITEPECHPVFSIRPGPVEFWERVRRLV